MLTTTAKSTIECRIATWAEYVQLRDDPSLDWQRISFDQGWLRLEMGKEGPGN